MAKPAAISQCPIRTSGSQTETVVCELSAISELPCRDVREGY
jgi:hypothetical protein